MDGNPTVRTQPRTPTEAGASTLPLTDTRRVNDVCERFEADWRSRSGHGPPPRIEDAAAGWSGPEAAALHYELIALELELRREAGDCPVRREYLERFPAHAPAVVNAFGGAETVSIGGAETVACPFDPDATVARRGPPVDPDDPLGAFGDYELIGEIARGGMGVVFRARQKSLNRVVALKMILTGPFASPEETRRFGLEAELAANLDHPNIVPVYEVGAHEGRHYFTMKLLDGGNLCREVPRLLNDPTAAARLVATVARAVHYAHRRGFVHCDLKPGNILLDADGQPHVTDFGLARRFDGDSTLTDSGALLGTPCYMAPEQITGDRRDLTPAADVYALGAILYELLAGRPPFRAGSQFETVLQVQEREPTPPGRVRRGVPRELETVCLKCLEKTPESRFCSAAELAETLDQYLRGEGVAGTSSWQRFRRWTRREPELVSRLGGLALVAALTHYNYYHVPDPSAPLHYLVLTELGLWAVASYLFQFVLRRGLWHGRARTVWALTDIVALTGVLLLLDGFDSDLVVGYPLLIAASGLWSRVRLVWVTTALAIAGYGTLYLTALLTRVDWHPKHYSNIFLAALLVTGFVIARQVKRIWVLNTYYENRPAG